MGVKYNILIVGTGKIGAFFDTPQCDKILTHAHAFSSLENFNFIGFVDSRINKAKEAASLWKSRFFWSLEDAFKHNRIDVVCITVSTKSHFEVLKRLANFPIKLAFIEKPFTNNLSHAMEIKELFGKKNIQILVNYSRRFVSEFEYLKNKIIKSKLKEDIEPQEVLLDSLAKKREMEDGFSEKKLEVPLLKKILHLRERFKKH